MEEAWKSPWKYDAMMAVFVGEILKDLRTKVESSDLANKPQISPTWSQGIAAPPDHAALVHNVRRLFGWAYIVLRRVGCWVVTIPMIR